MDWDRVEPVTHCDRGKKIEATRRAAEAVEIFPVAGKTTGAIGETALITDEYLTINELAARLKLKPKTIKNKMATGVFKRGVHYFSPRGLRPRFKWSAVQAWLEEADKTAGQEPAGIPMARGYVLGGSRHDLGE